MENLNRQCVFEDLFVMPIETKKASEALDILSDAMYRKGLVKEEYKAAVIEREGTFPTGIPTATPAAIPHTDAEHCTKTAMGVGLAKNPISFGVMGGDDGETVDLQLIFMLSLPEPKNQVAVIQRVVKMLRDNVLMDRLVHSNLEEMKNLLELYFQTGC